MAKPVSEEDKQLILKIGKKAGLEMKIDPLTVVICLSTVHSNGNPLRLQEMLEAGPEDSNFAHDIAGIINNLDQSTGKLMNFFSPRFSQN